MKKIISTIFLTILMIINPVISVDAASQVSVIENISIQKSDAGISEKSIQHQKYVPYIKKFNQEYKKYARQQGFKTSMAKTYFVFADIDKDGTDECILHALYDPKDKNITTCSYMNPYNEKTYVYAIKNGKVKNIIQQGLRFGLRVPNIQIYKNRKNIEFWWSYGHNFYSYRNGVLSKKVSASCSSPQRYGDPWYVNEKVVSKSVYNKFMNKMTNNSTGYKMYQYTTANLKRFL